MHNRTPGRFHPPQGETLSDMLRRYSEKVRFRKNKRQAAFLEMRGSTRATYHD